MSTSLAALGRGMCTRGSVVADVWPVTQSVPVDPARARSGQTVFLSCTGPRQLLACTLRS